MMGPKSVRTGCFDCGDVLVQRPGSGRPLLRCDGCRLVLKRAWRRGRPDRRCQVCGFAADTMSTYCLGHRPAPPGGRAATAGRGTS